MAAKELMQLPPEKTAGLFGSYAIGFSLSVGFTLVAYFGTTHGWFADVAPTVLLLVLALLQLVVQLFFFLHVGRELKPRWKLFMLFLAIVFAVVVIVGSIWVMYSLNYRMQPDEIKQYLQEQDGGI